MSTISHQSRGSACAFMVLVLLAGCGDRGSPASPDAGTHPPRDKSPPSAGVAAKVPAQGLCGLLTHDEVSAVFPDAEDGKTTVVPMEGVTACTWAIPAGRFVLESWAVHGPLKDEIRDLVSGSTDPFKSTDNVIRYETVANVGDEALAVLENEDAERGILSDVAVLVARRGDRILVILADDLPRRDRTQALAALQSLGSAAAGRL